MTDEVNAAIVQVAWTGDKESMIEVHEKYVAEAAAAGVQVIVLPRTVLRALLLSSPRH